MSTRLLQEHDAAAAAEPAGAEPMVDGIPDSASNSAPNSAPMWRDTTAVTLRQNPERLAWIVLLASFAIFVSLLVAIPLTFRYTVRYATVQQDAYLEATQGTLRYYPARSAEPIAVTSTRDNVTEGSIIQAADGATQGTLRFIETENAENALGSIRLYSNTSLRVEQIRKPMFERSPEPYRVHFHLSSGQVRIFTNSSTGRALHVELDTPHGILNMDRAGQYEISVTEERTDITVRSGTLELINGSGEQVAIDEQLRAWMTEDAVEQHPVTAVPNLVQNGDFSSIQDESRAEPWEVYGQTERAEGVRPGSVQFIQHDGRGVAYFSRTEGVSAHTEVEISQPIGRDVNINESLVAQLDVRLSNQTLAGGGTLGTEFPLRVEIEYTTIYGQVLTWGHGFYYRDPAADDDEQNDYWLLDRETSTKIPQHAWYTYESENLVALFAEQGTPIARLNSIRIYASGHKYVSMVSDVSILAE